ncbi:MAG: hypothetical protein GC152_15395 [Alphaproteobacteria bacterium]|nr:hypothetical protein [Alphaproteobacteria bacterium]
MTRSRLAFAIAAILGLAGAGLAYAHGDGDPSAAIDLVVNSPEGEVGEDEGLAAWENIYAVVSHPRCSNCHVDDSNTPMWSGPSYGEARPHGMNINAGASRIGAESLPCGTCHIQSTAPNDHPHAAPHAGLTWMLAPVEFAWFGKDSADVCRQIRDPERNGGRDGAGLVEHIVHDAQIKAFITWGFNPGGGREPAPGTMQAHLDDMVMWTAAGMPCPGE